MKISPGNRNLAGGVITSSAPLNITLVSNVVDDSTQVASRQIPLCFAFYNSPDGMCTPKIRPEVFRDALRCDKSSAISPPDFRKIDREGLVSGSCSPFLLLPTLP